MNECKRKDVVGPGKGEGEKGKKGKTTLEAENIIRHPVCYVYYFICE